MSRRTTRKSLPLFPEAQPPRRPDTPAPSPQTPGRSAAPVASRARRLWLCVRLPGLALEAFGPGDETVPLAVAEGEGGARTVLTCNRAAARGGIRSGLGLNAAYALLPDLKLLDRKPRRERQALERLAAWCMQFTSVVALEPPSALLLEIRGSLRLFGGLAALRTRIGDGLAALGHRAVLSVAPVPQAASWLSRAGDETPVTQASALAGRVGAVPLDCLDWPVRVVTSLRGMGLETVGDCARLPRDGFARRVGRKRLDDIDRALGRCPDPRTGYVPPDRFRASLELPAEVHTTERIEPAVRRLLGSLGGFLRGRQMGIQTLTLALGHQDAPETRVRLGLLAPDRSPDRLAGLLRERLDRVHLPAPVVSLGMRSGKLFPLTGTSVALFDASRSATDGMPQLVERLRARLGEDAAYSVCLVPEHRPEAAWRKQPAASGSRTDAAEPDEPSANRPLWMLAEPRQLETRAGRPRFEGELTLVSGPERIETGWWDGRDVARDYYVVVNGSGMRLWIYRDRRPPRRWYLHGLF